MFQPLTIYRFFTFWNQSLKTLFKQREKHRMPITVFLLLFIGHIVTGHKVAVSLISSFRTISYLYRCFAQPFKQSIHVPFVAEQRFNDGKVLIHIFEILLLALFVCRSSGYLVQNDFISRIHLVQIVAITYQYRFNLE